MTDDEILQSKIDHAHHRADAAAVVLRNTPSRVSTAHKMPVKGLRDMWVASVVVDYSTCDYVIIHERRRR